MTYYNGWKNWDTWEAYNALAAADWGVYKAACSAAACAGNPPTGEDIRRFKTETAGWIIGFEPEIDLSLVDWPTLVSAIAG